MVNKIQYTRERIPLWCLNLDEDIDFDIGIDNDIKEKISNYLGNNFFKDVKKIIFPKTKLDLKSDKPFFNFISLAKNLNSIDLKNIEEYLFCLTKINLDVKPVSYLNLFSKMSLLCSLTHLYENRITGDDINTAIENMELLYKDSLNGQVAHYLRRNYSEEFASSIFLYSKLSKRQITSFLNLTDTLGLDIYSELKGDKGWEKPIYFSEIPVLIDRSLKEKKVLVEKFQKFEQKYGSNILNALKSIDPLGFLIYLLDENYRIATGFSPIFFTPSILKPNVLLHLSHMQVDAD